MDTNQSGAAASAPDAPKTKLSSPLELLQGAFEMYKNNFWRVLALMASSYVVAIIFAVIVVGAAVALGVGAIFMQKTGADVSGQAAPFVLVAIAVAGGLFLAAVIVYISATFQVATMMVFSLPEQATSFSQAFSNARTRVWGFLLLSFLTGILLLLWAILLIIPAIVMAIYYSFAIWAYLCEGLRGMDAIKRSKQIIKGYWWAVFLRYLLVYVVVWVVMVAFSVAGNSASDGVKMTLNFISEVVSLIIGPFFIAYSYLMYKELVAIKSSAAPAPEVESLAAAPVNQ